MTRRPAPRFGLGCKSGLDAPAGGGYTPPARCPRRDAGCGAIAQLGERLNGIQEVVGSIPIGSTIPAQAAWRSLTSFSTATPNASSVRRTSSAVWAMERYIFPSLFRMPSSRIVCVKRFAIPASARSTPR